MNRPDEYGWTALHWASGKGDVHAVRLLIENGANISTPANDERTPLMIAKAAGRKEVVDILTAAEQTSDSPGKPTAQRPYCKAYEIGNLRQYPHWSEKGVPLNDAEIVYLHQNLAVTKSIWSDEEVIFADVTPEWSEFCQRTLQFAIPGDLL